MWLVQHWCWGCSQTETHLNDINQDNFVVVLKIHWVIRTDDIGDRLDYGVSVKLIVTAHCRPNRILYNEPPELVMATSDRSFSSRI